MGILDEAIREHLALKRRQGLSDEEIKRLEDEAFGPPARPGEPDFPERDFAEDPGTATAESSADEMTVSDQPPGERPAPEELDGSEEPTLFFEHAQGGAEDEPPAAVEGEPAEAPLAEAEAEQAALEPTPGEEPEEQVAAESAEGPQPQAEGDQLGGVEEEMPAGELDISGLDLDLGDSEMERPEAPSPAGPSPAERDVAPAPPPPIESLETVEHRIEDAPEPLSEEHRAERGLDEPPSDEYDVEPDSDEYSYEPESDEYTLEPDSDVHALDEDDSPEADSEPEGPAGEEEEDEEAEGDDVLGATPDFLRDAPEDDELWFEQGEPKDFDF